MVESTVDKLKILLCSDAHESWSNLDYICKHEQTDYDYVFISGDQANCNNKLGAAINEEENKAAVKSNETFVTTLHSLVKQGGKVIYIPGNHDAEILFKPEDAPKIGNSENIHNRTI